MSQSAAPSCGSRGCCRRPGDRRSGGAGGRPGAVAAQHPTVGVAAGPRSARASRRPRTSATRRRPGRALAADQLRGGAGAGPGRLRRHGLAGAASSGCPTPTIPTCWPALPIPGHVRRPLRTASSWRPRAGATANAARSGATRCRTELVEELRTAAEGRRCARAVPDPRGGEAEPGGGGELGPTGSNARTRPTWPRCAAGSRTPTCTPKVSRPIAIPHVITGHPRHTDLPLRDFEIGMSGQQQIEADVDERPLIAVLSDRLRHARRAARRR